MKANNSPFLLVHGLNDTPKTMLDLENQFKEWGYKANSIQIDGHSHEEWLSQLEKEVQLILKENEKINLLGHSLGAVLIHELMQKKAIKERVEKIVYFSPAFFPHRLLRIARFFPPSFKIISIAPKELRKGDFTPVKAYQSLDILTRRKPNFDYKALTLSHPRDEAISHKRLKNHLKSPSEIVFVELEMLKKTYYHLTMMRENYTESQWKQILGTLSDFISQ